MSAVRKPKLSRHGGQDNGQVRREAALRGANVMGMLYADLESYPPLSVAEERRLTRIACGGAHDQTARDSQLWAARERLLLCNMRLVIMLARDFARHAPHHSLSTPGVDEEDFVMAGIEGLRRAIERFEPARGFKFSTYATPWIRQAMQRAWDNEATTIRLPTFLHRRRRQLRRAAEDLESATGIEPTLEQTAARVGLTTTQAQQALAACDAPDSLERPVAGRAGAASRLTPDSDTQLADLIGDHSGEDGFRAVEENDLVERVLDIIREDVDRGRLDARALEILVIRTLAGPGKRTPLADLAEQMGVSRQRIFQLETCALERIRKELSRRGIRSSAQLLGETPPSPPTGRARAHAARTGAVALEAR